MTEIGFEGHEERLNDILAKESEDGGGHSNDTVDGLDGASGDGVDGIFGGVNEVNAEEAEAEDEEAFFGEKPNLGEIRLLEMEVSLAKTWDVVENNNEGAREDEHDAGKNKVVGE